LRPGAAAVAIEADVEAGWLASRYVTEDRRCITLFNLQAEPSLAKLDLNRGRWIRLIATDEERYGEGASLSPPEIVNDSEEPVSMEVAGHTATLYAWEPN
jgi:hypothetical protein